MTGEAEMRDFSFRKGLWTLASMGALTLAALVLVVPAQAERPDPGDAPCWFAGVNVCCEFTRVCSNEDPNDCHYECDRWVGTSRDGGQSPGECNDILEGMLIEAAYDGCWTRNAECWKNTRSNAACLGSFGGEPSPKASSGN